MSEYAEHDPRHPHERRETEQQEAPVYDKDGRCLVCCRDEMLRLEKKLAAAKQRLGEVERECRAIAAMLDGYFQHDQKKRLMALADSIAAAQAGGEGEKDGM